MADEEDFALDDLDLNGGDQLDSTLSRLRTAIREAIDLETTVKEVEEELKAYKKALQHVQTITVPDLMAQIGLSEAVIDNVRVTVEQKIVGGWPKDEEAARKAAQWLETHDAGGLIKVELGLQFGRGELEEAHKVASELAAEGYEPEVNETVHPQTLYAFARERLKSGEDIDLETLGLTALRLAKLKLRT